MKWQYLFINYFERKLFSKKLFSGLPLPPFHFLLQPPPPLKHSYLRNLCVVKCENSRMGKNSANNPDLATSASISQTNLILCKKQIEL